MLKISYAASPTGLALVNRFQTLAATGAANDRGGVVSTFVFFGG